MSRRTLKVAEAVRETVAMAILTEIQDPRVHNVTVTYVEVTGDLRLAKVKVSVMGTPAQQELCLKGLQSSAGFFQTKIAKRIKSRYVPRVEFILDQGVKHSIEVSRVLKELLPQENKLEDDSEEYIDEDMDNADDDSADDDSADDDSADDGITGENSEDIEAKA